MSELPALPVHQRDKQAQARHALGRTGLLIVLALGLGLASGRAEWYTILALGPLILAYGFLTRLRRIAASGATLAVLAYLGGSLLALLGAQPSSSINRIGVVFWAITASLILGAIAALTVRAPQNPLHLAPHETEAGEAGPAQPAQGRRPVLRANWARWVLAILLLLSGDAWLLQNYSVTPAPVNTYLLSLQVTAPTQQVRGLTLVFPLPMIDGRPYDLAHETVTVAAENTEEVPHSEQVISTDRGPALAITMDSLPRLLGPVVPHTARPEPRPGAAVQRVADNADATGKTGAVSRSSTNGTLDCPGLYGTSGVKVLDPYLPSCSLAYLGSFQESYAEATPGAFTHPLRFSHAISVSSSGALLFPIKVVADEDLVVEVSLALTSITDAELRTNPLVSQPLHHIQQHVERIDIVARPWNGWQTIPGHLTNSTENTFVPFS